MGPVKIAPNIVKASILFVSKPIVVLPLSLAVAEALAAIAAGYQDFGPRTLAYGGEAASAITAPVTANATTAAKFQRSTVHHQRVRIELSVRASVLI